MSNDRPDISIIGLPPSGKTTFLAAVWHMVRERGSATALKFDALSEGSYDHINSLAKRWRSGKKQQRTQTCATEFGICVIAVFFQSQSFATSRAG